MLTLAIIFFLSFTIISLVYDAYDGFVSAAVITLLSLLALSLISVITLDIVDRIPAYVKNLDTITGSTYVNVQNKEYIVRFDENKFKVAQYYTVITESTTKKPRITAYEIPNTFVLKWLTFCRVMDSRTYVIETYPNSVKYLPTLIAIE